MPETLTSRVVPASAAGPELRDRLFALYEAA